MYVSKMIEIQSSKSQQVNMTKQIIISLGGGVYDEDFMFIS